VRAMRVAPACQLTFDVGAEPDAADLWMRLPEISQRRVLGLLAAMITAGVLIEDAAASIAAAAPADGAGEGDG
jgi:hypothetical protein